MLKRSDLTRLVGKSADVVAKELKKIGKGNMGAAPVKVWDSAILRISLIFGGIEVIQIGIWGIPKIKKKIAESNRIHNILNNIDNAEKDDDNIENQTNDMEEQ